MPNPTSANDIREKVLNVLGLIIGSDVTGLLDAESIRNKFNADSTDMSELFVGLQNQPPPIIVVPFPLHLTTDSIQDIIDFVGDTESESQPAEGADPDSDGGAVEPAAVVAAPDLDVGTGEQTTNLAGPKSTVSAVQPPLDGSVPESTGASDDATSAGAESFTTQPQTVVAPVETDSAQPEDFLTTLATHFKEKGWDPGKLIATWKLSYQSLMISYITGGGGLCASWIGPDGHGIVTLTKTVSPADSGNGWFTWAEGELVGDKQGEGIGDKHEIITYELAYNSDEDAIRIQPKDTGNWKPATCCSIVIAKKNVENDKIADRAVMTNNLTVSAVESIELTKRDRT